MNEWKVECFMFNVKYVKSFHTQLAPLNRLYPNLIKGTFKTNFPFHIIFCIAQYETRILANIWWPTRLCVIIVYKTSSCPSPSPSNPPFFIKHNLPYRHYTWPPLSLLYMTLTYLNHTYPLLYYTWPSIPSFIPPFSDFSTSHIYSVNCPSFLSFFHPIFV